METVVDAPGPGPRCDPAPISMSPTPGRSSTHDNRFRDQIFNQNGPPSKVAPCSDRTKQTLNVGPTAADVNHCTYDHEQLTEVTVTARDGKGTPMAGDVITSVIVTAPSEGRQSTRCKWISPQMISYMHAEAAATRTYLLAIGVGASAGVRSAIDELLTVQNTTDPTVALQAVDASLSLLHGVPDAGLAPARLVGLRSMLEALVASKSL
jgi:hypothetical protein